MCGVRIFLGIQALNIREQCIINQKQALETGKWNFAYEADGQSFQLV